MDRSCLARHPGADRLRESAAPGDEDVGTRGAIEGLAASAARAPFYLRTSGTDLMRSGGTSAGNVSPLDDQRRTSPLEAALSHLFGDKRGPERANTKQRKCLTFPAKGCYRLSQYQYSTKVLGGVMATKGHKGYVVGKLKDLLPPRKGPGGQAAYMMTEGWEDIIELLRKGTLTLEEGIKVVTPPNIKKGTLQNSWRHLLK